LELRLERIILRLGNYILEKAVIIMDYRVEDRPAAL